MAAADGNSPADEVLAALGYALFFADENGALALQGNAPDWLRALWPALKQSRSLAVEQASPFLENFLIDAADCWHARDESRAESGPWIETAPDGSELTLEATALTAAGQSILLVARQGEAFEKKKAILQSARETVIAYQRLNSETQKKEVLLSWIAEQMNSALANIITSLRLIELENNPARTRQLLQLASRAADEQQALINKVLTVFAKELEGLHSQATEGGGSADVPSVLQTVQSNIAPQFTDKGVHLVLPNGTIETTPVAMNQTHLARMLLSLVEAALHNAESEVRVELRTEPQALVIRVCDDGQPLPADICDGLSSRGAMVSQDGDGILLRLQFCRMAVENAQGELGYEAQRPNGNCLWVRLPLAHDPP